MAGSCGSQAGGISGLVALIERDGEAIDADLQCEYGLSLNDLAAGRVSFRRLRDLIAGMPPEGTARWRKAVRSPGAPARASKPDPVWWATGDRRLLADLIYTGQVANWQRAGGKGARPKHMADAPNVTRMGATTLPPAQAMAALDRIGLQRN